MTHPHLPHVIQRNVKFWRSATLHWDHMIVQACTTAQPFRALYTSYHISNNLIILIIYPQAPRGKTDLSHSSDGTASSAGLTVHYGCSLGGKACGIAVVHL